MADHKIKTQEELAKIIQDLKKQGKKVITTGGAFDMIHIGHVQSLERIKEYGDILVVCVNSDSSIKKYKSDKRPFIGEVERARMLAALEVTDYITIFTETDPSAVLEKLKPSLHAKGTGYENKFCPEKEVVERNGGKMIIVDSQSTVSTSGIINKILDAFKGAC